MDIWHKRIIVIVAVLLAAVTAAAIYIAARFPGQAGFTPPPFEENAVAGRPGDLNEALLYSPLALSDVFFVSLCASPTVDRDGQALLYFTSNENNAFFVRLLVLSEEGRQLGATGLLRAGEYVASVLLDPPPEDGEALTLKILSYEPDTYYSMGTASARVTIRKI